MKLENLSNVGIAVVGGVAGASISSGEQAFLIFSAVTFPVIAAQAARSYIYASSIKRILNHQPETTLDKIVEHPAVNVLIGEKRSLSIEYTVNNTLYPMPKREAILAASSALIIGALIYYTSFGIGHVLTRPQPVQEPKEISARYV